MQIFFNKFQGTGNDFIMIDGINTTIELDTEQVKMLCNRNFGVGADGLIVLKKARGFDFEMIYYNADGHTGSMCGNGGRCAVQFARKTGIQKEEYFFLATDGDHIATIDEKNNWVSLKMKDVYNMEKVYDDFVLDTGSPHYVKVVSDGLKYFDVYNNGLAIRKSPDFPEGINVNFIEAMDENTIFVRTFERGVENETLSCGTGVTAASLSFAQNKSLSCVNVETLGGRLKVSFEQTGAGYENIWLSGPATFVFAGSISL